MHNFMHECVPDDNEPIRPKGTVQKSLQNMCRYDHPPNSDSLAFDLGQNFKNNIKVLSRIN